MEIKIIDISRWNGDIDFEKVKKSGINGVIIRAGFGSLLSQKDPKFETYYTQAKAAGLNVGAYWYSYTVTTATAKTEAECFLKTLKNKTFELPVYLDIEEKKQAALTKELKTSIIETFAKVIEDAGYWFGVYSYDAFFGGIYESIQSKYTCWVARVENVKPKVCKKYDMWQYSWKGSVDGISGNVDMDICTRDFPALIKRYKKNGFN